MNRKTIFLILVLIFSASVAFNHVFLYSEISTASGGTQEDFILEFTAGKNFTLKGFSKLFFLPDYSTDFTQNSQPVFYTHNPPLPAVVQGFLIKIGLTLFQQRIFYAIISLLGVVFLYLFVSGAASVTAAVFSSVFLTLNFSGFVGLIDHSSYSFSFPLLFGYLWLRHSRSPKKYIIAPIIFLISSFVNYMLLGFMLIVEFFLFIFEKDKKLFFWSVLGGISGVAAHIVQNMVALTPVVAWQDIWMTIKNRICANPTRDEMLIFYQRHNLVLWGSNSIAPVSSYLRGFIMPFYLFKVPLALGAISFFVSYFSRRENIYKNIKIIIPLFLAVLIWQALFLPTIGQHPLFFHSFLVVFLGIILGDLIHFLTKEFNKNSLMIFKNLALKALILLAVILIVFKYFVWAGGFANDEDLSNLLKTLKSYQGKTFFTNIMPPTVSFGTKTWTVGHCLPEGLVNLDPAKCYAKFVSLEDKKLIPDYILLSSQFFSFRCGSECFLKLKNDLASKYKLVEEANNGKNMIYKVKDE